MKLFFILLIFNGQDWGVTGPLQNDLQKYLPQGFISRAKQVLQNIPLEKTEKPQTNPSVKFVSGQSYTASGQHIINRIHFFPGKEIDTWLMNQRAEGSTWMAKHWTTLTLMVDKTTTPKTAYFLQWEKNAARDSSFHPSPFTAMCFTCHANGPRAIRPQYFPSLAKLNQNQWNKIYDWNEIISDYGEIQTYKPRVDITHQELPMDLSGRIDNEPLKNKTCTGCHNTGSGVRSPLLRQHGDSILALTENTGDATGYYISALHQEYAFMPLIGHSLSSQDLECIKDWINNRSMRSPKTGCNSNGEKTTNSPSKNHNAYPIND